MKHPVRSIVYETILKALLAGKPRAEVASDMGLSERDILNYIQKGPVLNVKSKKTDAGNFLFGISGPTVVTFSLENDKSGGMYEGYMLNDNPEENAVVAMNILQTLISEELIDRSFVDKLEESENAVEESDKIALLNSAYRALCEMYENNSYGYNLYVVEISSPSKRGFSDV